MLKGDISLLAKACGVSKSTIYRVAEKIGLDLAPIHGRCDKTVDCFRGYTLHDEQQEWLQDAIADITAYRKKVREEKETDKTSRRARKVETQAAL